jgi:hypothetical protein
MAGVPSELPDTEEVTGSIPVPPTQTQQVNDLTLRYANLPGPLVPIPGTAVSDSGSRSWSRAPGGRSAEGWDDRSPQPWCETRTQSRQCRTLRWTR